MSKKIDQQFIQNILSQINRISSKIKAQFSQSTLNFHIPSHFIPPLMKFACNFYLSPDLINVTIKFNELSWINSVSSIHTSHPIFNQNYIVKNFVHDAIQRCFSNSFSHKDNYLSYEKIFGKDIIIDYQKDRFLTLILEICDCFFDIQDHCCICHQKLPANVTKPSCCEQQSCQEDFNTINVGPSVAQEIRRDYRSVDLLLSMFSASVYSNKYINPAPPEEILQTARSVLYEIPSMQTISEKCQNDSDILNQYGRKALDLLRWIIFSNESQMIHLPSELQLKDIPFQSQFMILNTSPEKEKKFQEKKEKVKKSYFRWYGNGADKWHSIIQNGLSSMKNSECGNYFSSELSQQLHHCSLSKNLYLHSELGSDLAFISLCEIVPVDGMFVESGAYTTITDEDAIMVRFIFPILRFIPANEIKYPIPMTDGVILLPQPIPLFGEPNRDFPTRPQGLSSNYVIPCYKYGIPKIQMGPSFYLSNDSIISLKEKLESLPVPNLEDILLFLENLFLK